MSILTLSGSPSAQSRSGLVLAHARIEAPLDAVPGAYVRRAAATAVAERCSA
ncbi:hypothetical protein [Cupriavidus sp. MP-37]|uniref:hypothetical protein n=1 Tax=Cupriavidus sp. MP-37 TaxID=2884455 RepID=UPI001D09C3CC|nr:hypothetical protein [Cupriavidus sp. MP-37]UDM51779.1 hypothetical protein LIN44_08385 [Cupriavidus sp. MP-37]